MTADTTKLERRLREAREEYVKECAELGVKPKFSDGRGVITAEMAAKMKCPWPPWPKDDLL